MPAIAGNVLRSMEEKDHGEMKHLVKFKEVLTVGMINWSEKRFFWRMSLNIHLAQLFFLLKCSRMYCLSKDGNKRDKTFNEG